MSDWNEGYVTEIDYNFGYYSMLNPAFARLPLAMAGLACPRFRTACELGFGQGLSTNLHAAASITQWFGTDFNPSQAAFAQELAAASGARATLYDEAFADFCTRADLPDFDFIGLHGIWSWVSDENRASIVNFIRRKLRVGGVVYVSYNTLPGWSAFAPMQHLMMQYDVAMGAQGRGLPSRIDDAISFAQKLLGANPGYGRLNPQIGERFKAIMGQNRQYLAHEYFNRTWDPMYFAAMAEWLAPAKLRYACSAKYADHLDEANLTPEHRAFLAEVPDATLRESVRDFMMNQSFRTDYWVKGPRVLTEVERADALQDIRIIMTRPRPQDALKMRGALGDITIGGPLYGALLDQLADHKPRSLGELAVALKGLNFKWRMLGEAIMGLVCAGQVSMAQDEEVIKQARGTSDKLNAYLMRKARSQTPITTLSSPVTGSGVHCSRMDQLFLLAVGDGVRTPEALARFAWSILSANGERLTREGAPLETAEANLGALTVQGEKFLKETLPTFEALQISGHRTVDAA